MNAMVLLLTPLIGWYLVVLMYRFTWKKNWIETCMIHEMPFRSQKGEANTKLNLFLHLGISCLISILYLVIWTFTNAFESQNFFAIALLTGLLHGIAVAIGLIIELTDKKDGFNQAILTLNAHVAYALIIGFMMYYNEQDSGIVTAVASLYEIFPQVTSIAQIN